MKKNLIVSITIILINLACIIFISDGLTYLITSLMALAIMGTILRNRSWVLNITRWAKANPKKARLIITGLQIVLMAIGIFAGNNFRELGYEFSDITTFVFSTTLIAVFLSVHFLPKRGTIAIPKAVIRQRFAFMCIALSSFVLMVITGNRIGDMYPNSPVTHALKAIDQAIFQVDSTQYADFNNEAPDPGSKKNQEQVLINGSSSMFVFASFIGKKKGPVASSTDPKKEIKAKLKAQTKKFEKRIKKLMNRVEKKRRLLAAGGMSAGSVALIVLLVIVTCAGACLVVGGISALVAGDALGVLAILGGVLIGWLAIKGIRNISQRDKQQKQGYP